LSKISVITNSRTVGMAGTDGRRKFAEVNREDQLDPLTFRNSQIQSMNWLDLATQSITNNYPTAFGRNLDFTTAANTTQNFPTATGLYPVFVQLAGREIGAKETFTIRNSDPTRTVSLVFNPNAPTSSGYNIVGRATTGTTQRQIDVPPKTTYTISVELKTAPPNAITFDVYYLNSTTSSSTDNATSGQAFMAYMTTTQTRGIGWTETRIVSGGGSHYALQHLTLPTDAASGNQPLYVNSDLQGVINNTTDLISGYIPTSATLLIQLTGGITAAPATGTVRSVQYTNGVANPVVTQLGTANFNTIPNDGTTQALTVAVSPPLLDFVVGQNYKVSAEWMFPISVTGTFRIIGCVWNISYTYP
jgi:hypothetical protein